MKLMVISLLLETYFVDGDVKGESLDELFTSRANYFVKIMVIHVNIIMIILFPNFKKC